jgi:hypothetical protein
LNRLVKLIPTLRAITARKRPRAQDRSTATSHNTLTLAE